jgi:hypothetical protein
LRYKLFLFYSADSRSYHVEETERERNDDRWRETNSFDFPDLETVKTAPEMAQKWIKGGMMPTVQFKRLVTAGRVLI